MRRPVGLVLIGLGAFLLTLAPMMRFYVTDRVVVAPLNFYQDTRLEAQNASYFDLSRQKVLTGVTLAANNTVRGDTRANRGNDDIAVWDVSTSIYDRKTNKQVEFQGYRIAFDRHSSQLVNCCGSNVGGDSNVQMSGYGLLFPLGHVEKTDYSFFDMTTKRALPMRFNGEEKVHGLKAYRFVQEVPLMRTTKLDFKLSGALLGMGKKTGLQPVDRYFGATITTWVDPRTGVPVKHRQDIRQTVQTPDGAGKLTVASADLITIDADQKGLVKVANGYATDIKLVEEIIPGISVVLGLVLLALGCFICVRAPEPAPKAPRGAAKPPARKPDGKFGSTDPGTLVVPPATENAAGPVPEPAADPERRRSVRR